MGIWAAAAIAFPILGLLTEGLMMSAANIAKVLARRLAIMLAAFVLRAGVILLMVLGAAFLLLWIPKHSSFHLRLLRCRYAHSHSR